VPADLDGLSAAQVDALSFVPAAQRGIFEGADLDSLRILADELLRGGEGKLANPDGSFSRIVVARGARPEAPCPTPEPSARERVDRAEHGLAHRQRVARGVAGRGGRAAPGMLANVAASRARLAVQRARLRLAGAVAVTVRPRAREHRATRRATRAARSSRGSPSGEPSEPEPPSSDSDGGRP
jgi:hypothetical protein